LCLSFGITLLKISSNDENSVLSNDRIADGEFALFENSGGARRNEESSVNTLLGSDSDQAIRRLNKTFDQTSYSHTKYNPIGKTRVNELSCWYTNPTSLNNKMADFTCCINFDKLDLIFIAETWCNDTSIPYLDSYCLFRRDRGSKGGGVAIYISNKITSSEVNTLCYSKRKNKSGVKLR
jgi:hypothetical protein